MIGDMIDTFTNSTPAVNEESVGKIKLRQVPVTESSTRKADESIISSQFTPFCCQYLSSFHSKQHEN